MKFLSLLLVPILGMFSLQGSLEIVHPLAEESAPGHNHAKDGPALCALPGADVHPSHYCLHLNAFAPIARSTTPLNADAVRTSAGADYEPPLVERARDVFGRGPPLPG